MKKNLKIDEAPIHASLQVEPHDGDKSPAQYPPTRNPKPETRNPIHLVLHAPRIPQNTGQIARGCLAMGCRLHLIRPLGFRVDAPALRRAAVGHLEQVDLEVHADGEAFWSAAPNPDRVWLVTKHGRLDYAEVAYQPGDWLVFGNETEGLPPEWLQRHAERTVRIPMVNPAARCLNLATAAAVVMFEALRQVGNRVSGLGDRSPTRPPRGSATGAQARHSRFGDGAGSGFRVQGLDGVPADE